LSLGQLYDPRDSRRVPSQNRQERLGEIRRDDGDQFWEYSHGQPMHITSSGARLGAAVRRLGELSSAVFCRWMLFVCFTLAVAFPRSASAQFTDPRNYENFPVRMNQIE
jgi:hypothetical protein